MISVAPFCKSMARTLGAVLVLLMTTSCASRFATLEGVVRDGKALSPDELQEVSVVRKGARVPVAAGMAIKPQDEITVCDSCRALFTVEKQYQVALNSGTEATLYDPSLDLRKGLAYIKKLVAQAKDLFKVNTKDVALVVSGTEFLVGVNSHGDASIAVLDGAVTVSSKANAWVPVTYVRGQKGTIRDGKKPAPPTRMTTEESRSSVQWVRDLNKATSAVVPSVVGMSENDARRAIEDAGLILGTISTTITGAHDVGTVVTQHPVAHTPARVGMTIRITVEEPSVTVPTLVGLSRDQAFDALNSLGLTVKEAKDVDNPGDTPVGRVLTQNPPAGTRVKPGSSVSFTVARAPIAMCTVPNVVGKTLDEARAILRNSGLQMGTATPGGNAEGDTIYEQSPPAGQKAPCGSSVDVKYLTIH